MPSRRPEPPTTSQVNRAGRALRHLITEDRPLDLERYSEALSVVVRYRAAHQYPLTKANNGLRSFLASEGLPVEVSQRLKRVPTILDKLARQPTMQLATMQDIGGCRAVLGSVGEVRAAERRLARSHPPLRVADYLAQPRSSGYRAVHVVVAYDDQWRVARAIEVQLRTRVMHEWAVTVERLGGRIHEDLKSGIGPPPVLEFLRAVSDAMAIEEDGGTVPLEVAEEIGRLRRAALPYLGGPTGRSSP